MEFIPISHKKESAYTVFCKKGRAWLKNVTWKKSLEKNHKKENIQIIPNDQMVQYSFAIQWSVLKQSPTLTSGLPVNWKMLLSQQKILLIADARENKL